MAHPSRFHSSRARGDASRDSRLKAFWRWNAARWRMHLLVVLPTLLAIVYFGPMASDSYLSEARFVVRQPDKKSSSNSSLSQFLSSAGISSSHDDLYTVRDFILSRDALQVLEENLDLRKAFASRDIDLLSRFNPMGLDDSFEEFYKYYNDNVVSADVDTTSSICVVKVKAYSAAMAHAINEALLFLGEGLVNELNDRARQDLIRVASQEVEAAEAADKAASLALSDYRNRQTLFDPTQQSSIQLQQVGKLQSDLLDVRGQLTQLRTFAAESPYIKALEKRAADLQKEIQSEMSKVTGGIGSLAQKMSEYERLTLERDYADKRLATALASLQDARDQAQRQQLYLGKIVSPNLPDEAIYPRRGRSIGITFICCLLVYGIVRLLYAGVKEHQS